MKKPENKRCSTRSAEHAGAPRSRQGGPGEEGAGKVHPATREVLPDDPLELRGVEVPGDADLMLRLLVEEYARMGWGAEEILALARDPFYQAFHALYRSHGEDALRSRIQSVLDRVGVLRVCASEKVSADPDPVELDLPASS